MKVILFGATGMIGQGVLRECLAEAGVERMLAVGRAATGQKHDRLRDLVVPDVGQLMAVRDELVGYDACLFCLGVSSTGMTEAEYRRVTYDIAVGAATTLLEASPGLTLVFVSGGGTNAKGRAMWARVKGETENALLAMPFSRKYMVRPAFIQPLHGIVSRTTLYRVVYAVLRPLYPLLRLMAPKYVTTTEIVGRAMIRIAREGAEKAILENADLNALGDAGVKVSP